MMLVVILASLFVVISIILLWFMTWAGNEMFKLEKELADCRRRIE